MILSSGQLVQVAREKGMSKGFTFGSEILLANSLTTIDDAETKHESITHRELCKSVIRWGIRNGCSVYPRNVGLAGRFAMGDLVLIRGKRKPLFIEVLGSIEAFYSLNNKRTLITTETELRFVTTAELLEEANFRQIETSDILHDGIYDAVRTYGKLRPISRERVMQGESSRTPTGRPRMTRECKWESVTILYPTVWTALRQYFQVPSKRTAEGKLRLSFFPGTRYVENTAHKPIPPTTTINTP